jgi:hypothetical protein
VNAIFGSIPILTKEISNIKIGEPIPVNQFSDLVTQTLESSNFLENFVDDLKFFLLLSKNLRIL